MGAAELDLLSWALRALLVASFAWAGSAADTETLKEVAG